MQCLIKIEAIGNAHSAYCTSAFLGLEAITQQTLVLNGTEAKTRS